MFKKKALPSIRAGGWDEIYDQQIHMSIKWESWESLIPGTQGYCQALFVVVEKLRYFTLIVNRLPATVSAWQTAYQMLKLSLPAIHCKLNLPGYFL